MALRNFKGSFLRRSDQWNDTTNFIASYSWSGTR
jgi:hypothetical protein